MIPKINLKGKSMNRFVLIILALLSTTALAQKTECTTLWTDTKSVCYATNGKRTVYTYIDVSNGRSSVEVITKKRYEELLQIYIDYMKEKEAEGRAESAKLEAQICANWNDVSTLPSYCKPKQPDQPKAVNRDTSAH